MLPGPTAKRSQKDVSHLGLHTGGAAGVAGHSCDACLIEIFMFRLRHDTAHTLRKWQPKYPVSLLV